MEDIKISQIIQKFESAATNFQKRINPKTLNIAYRNGSMVVIAALSSPPRIRFDLNEGIDFGLIYLHPPERTSGSTISAGYYLMKAILDKQTGIRYIKYIDNQGTEVVSKPSDFVVGHNTSKACDAGIDLSLTGVCAYVACEFGSIELRAEACFRWA